MTEIIAFIKKLPQVDLDIEVLSVMVHYAFTIVRLLQSQANPRRYSEYSRLDYFLLYRYVFFLHYAGI